MTGEECWLAMGHPVPGSPGVGKRGMRSPCEAALRMTSQSSLVKLIGNAQNLVAWGAWVLYCLSNIMLREDIVATMPTVMVDVDSEGSDAEA